MLKLQPNTEIYYPKRYLWYKLIGVILVLIAVLLVAIYYDEYDFLWRVFFMFLVLSVFYALFLYWFYINTTFSFDDKRITKRSGILNKQSTVIQFDRIQNIKLRSDIIMRLFNISIIEIWTASQSQLSLDKGGDNDTSADISLFLDSPQAEKLRLFMLEKEKIN